MRDDDATFEVVVAVVVVVVVVVVGGHTSMVAKWKRKWLMVNYLSMKSSKGSRLARTRSG